MIVHVGQRYFSWLAKVVLKYEANFVTIKHGLRIKDIASKDSDATMAEENSTIRTSSKSSQKTALPTNHLPHIPNTRTEPQKEWYAHLTPKHAVCYRMPTYQQNSGEKPFKPLAIYTGGLRLLLFLDLLAHSNTYTVPLQKSITFGALAAQYTNTFQRINAQIRILEIVHEYAWCYVKPGNITRIRPSYFSY
jgi:hypothetical protein